ncbi:hypothetical protein BDP27DRAFT_1367679 [Rhodocollybia butyracea]|uniref:Uncharacterized protein n=1 Tax=Rhodocollybia butyracea TaxID=206335 RepID=A0A9P5PDS7_9AGAR|nr:hypothetical protein BDP27DRAFT_1367679 [Rhodocollybia butyracea]
MALGSNANMVKTHLEMLNDPEHVAQVLPAIPLDPEDSTCPQHDPTVDEVGSRDETSGSRNEAGSRDKTGSRNEVQRPQTKITQFQTMLTFGSTSAGTAQQTVTHAQSRKRKKRGCAVCLAMDLEGKTSVIWGLVIIPVLAKSVCIDMRVERRAGVVPKTMTYPNTIDSI